MIKHSCESRTKIHYTIHNLISFKYLTKTWENGNNRNSSLCLSIDI